ncbi:MAG: hypothetical protein E7167_03565 [Firmicutes bacterium]|nr:hypothetical protein [Bacillota bacterium]
MSRVKARNPIVTKAVITSLVVILSVLLIWFCASIIFKSMSSLAYDIGPKAGLSNYKDFVLKNYYDYLDLVKKYNINEDLTIENFANNYYVVSFQEYDTCAESRIKDVEKVEIGDTINIMFKVYNKCGWCQKHIALHLIKIDKFSGNKEITYDYSYNKKLDCGTV